MADWNGIKGLVETNGDVVTVTMEDLRDAHGSGKLGVHVRAEISRALAGMGLGHVPQELPSYQHEQVRLYKNGTPIGDLIATVLNPGQQNDERLSKQFVSGGPDYAGIVQKIRELVNE